MNVKFSDFFQINLFDLGKSAIVTAISTLLGAISETFYSGAFPNIEGWKTAAVMGITAGISYIIKNLLSAAPKTVEIDPAKTTVVNKNNSSVLVKSTSERQIN